MEYKIKYAVENTYRAPRLDEVELKGLIGEKFDRLIYERITSDFAIDYILREAEDCFRDKFDDEYRFSQWHGEFWGKLAISACRVCRYTGNEKLKEALRASAHRMLTFRTADGYLSTFSDRKNVFLPSQEVVALDHGWASNWNVWSRKYTLWGMLECAMLLDDKVLLDASAQIADLLIEDLDELGIRIKDTGNFDGMPSCSIMKPMLILYRLTGDKRYLDLCTGMANEWDRDDGERPNLIRNALGDVGPADWYEESTTEWKAKAYEMMSCYDGIIELYRVTGNKRYLDACKGFYRQLVKYELNIAGNVGYCEMFCNAKEYPDMATEICDSIHWIRLCYELFCLTGDACYAESFEKSYVNSLIAGVTQDGRGSVFFLRSSGRHWHGDAHCQTRYQHCCLNNLPRGFINAAEMSVTESDEGYFINLYTMTTVRFGDTLIRVGDNYFSSGRVTITVRNLEKGKKLYLRVPDWSENMTVRAYDVTYHQSELEHKNGYVAVDVSGDTTVWLQFDMTPRVIDFAGKWRVLPDDEYHVRRWSDDDNGICNRAQMVKHPMAHIYRGAILLARSKRIGSKQEDMFNGETVYGKERTCEALRLQNDRKLAYCRIKLTCDSKVREFEMCDYPSAANIPLEDPWYFNVFI